MGHADRAAAKPSKPVAPASGGLLAADASRADHLSSPAPGGLAVGRVPHAFLPAAATGADAGLRRRRDGGIEAHAALIRHPGRPFDVARPPRGCGRRALSFTLP